jgi:prepilin-type N-terminal cleavage/methylation domain-containing protein/prepilin-type processing-associated H-X9-DG protein
MKRRKGFTLVELLVVIAVIALLMAILMPVLRRAQDQAMRILCGNRQKNLLLGFTMYADTHNNRIPDGGGAWPWDCEGSTAISLMRNMGFDVGSFTNNVQPQNPGGISVAYAPAPLPGMGGGGGPSREDYYPIQYSDNFYCPANKATTRFRSMNWWFTIGRQGGRITGYSVIGFPILWYAPWNSNGTRSIYSWMKPEDPATMVDLTKRWVDRVDIPQASERELVVDATISQFYNYDRTTYPYGNFVKITVGGNPIDSTSHWITDSKASGGNMGFVDGHVEWRPWTKMKIRWTYSGTPAGEPHFWW